MRSYDEIFASALDRPAFSNHTSWEMWAAGWCYRCANDSFGTGKDGQDCPLILAALMQKTPLEWLAETKEAEALADYHCIEFRSNEGGGGDDPAPPDEPMPGQELLFDPEPYRGVRMWADVVNEMRGESVGAQS
jgi:hypothetical protein